MLEHDLIDEMVDEYLNTAPNDSDPELRLVAAALFLEYCLGLRMRDEDFAEEKLGGSQALRAFAHERAGS